jgi:hypothetical protein
LAPHFFQKDREHCRIFFEKSGNLGKPFWKSPVTLPGFFGKFDNVSEFFPEFSEIDPTFF